MKFHHSLRSIFFYLILMCSVDALAFSYEDVRMLAEQGVPEGQYVLGLLYEQGEMVSQNVKEAEKWYRLAAEQGFSEAL